MFTIPIPEDFLSWRATARNLMENETHPSQTLWSDSDSLFSTTEIPEKSPSTLKVPAAFLKLAQTISVHRSGEQWPLLYSLLWRITHGERHILNITTDTEVHRAFSMQKHIRRDSHKMHAFVRFRKIGENPETGREQFVSWFEPDHKILRQNASFFRKRFTNMDWAILTPDECMHWDGKQIRFTPGARKENVPSSDAHENLWKTYYKSIFNPARLKTKAMQAEMPKKYWKNLPEADLIEGLISSSKNRTHEMLQTPTSPEKPAPKNKYL
ncbi:MAG: TIGR03915 family putative DNA repair protein, partial [Luteolibacter sp.]